MDHTKLKGCHPGGDPVGLKGHDGMNTLSSYQAGRDDMITIIKSEIERRQKENYKQAGLFAAGRVVEDADILSFLSTLESEKPKPISTEDMPYITDEHFYEREPADSFKYKLAEYMTKNCKKGEGPYGYSYNISSESILQMAKEELIKRGELKEQKPAWSEEDEKHLISLCRIIHGRVVNKELSLAEESELGKWIDKWINHKPQPVQKWDEFDEGCLKRAIWYIENPAPSVVKDTNLALWLESLPKRFNLQPKQEWIEEDEKNLELVIDCVYEFYPDPVMKYKLKDWLTQRFKSLRTCPSWKPSDHQMNILKAVKEYVGRGSGYWGEGLGSLIEDLDKL